MANQATVHRAKFNNPGTPGALPTFTGLSSYTLNFGTDNVRIGFGDIAFSDGPAGNDVLYLPSHRQTASRPIRPCRCTGCDRECDRHD
jgi:hypothetical protein